LRICASRNKKFGSQFEQHPDIIRTITLGDLVIEEKVHAKLENSVPEVILPKVKKFRARLVPIQ
jgi:HSP20 family molecular chaperone IbpA